VSGAHPNAAAPAKLARDMIGAYATGWFPVDKDPDGPILWNTVEQRAVIQPTNEGLARVQRERKRHRWKYEVRLDEDFDIVLAACAAPRGNNVWLTGRLCDAYRVLRDMGFCRCCTAYDPAGKVAGGVLLVTIARVSFIETTFHWSSNAGNAALLWTLELVGADNPVTDADLVSCPGRRVVAAGRPDDQKKLRLGRSLAAESMISAADLGVSAASAVLACSVG
jgi:leucyl/phenylalanyl-tRNA--protein transferase